MTTGAAFWSSIDLLGFSVKSALINFQRVNYNRFDVDKLATVGDVYDQNDFSLAG